MGGGESTGFACVGKLPAGLPQPFNFFSGVNDVDFTGIEHLEQFLEELKEKEHGMTLVLTKVKVQVLNQLTIGEICGDGHIIPKENILWEIHEAEEWWDQKIGAAGKDKA